MSHEQSERSRQPSAADSYDAPAPLITIGGLQAAKEGAVDTVVLLCGVNDFKRLPGGRTASSFGNELKGAANAWSVVLEKSNHSQHSSQLLGLAHALELNAELSTQLCWTTSGASAATTAASSSRRCRCTSPRSFRALCTSSSQQRPRPGTPRSSVSAPRRRCAPLAPQCSSSRNRRRAAGSPTTGGRKCFCLQTGSTQTMQATPSGLTTWRTRWCHT